MCPYNYQFTCYTTDFEENADAVVLSGTIHSQIMFYWLLGPRKLESGLACLVLVDEVE